MDKKNILLFSTLNPYPFWAGSENLWFDFVTDQRAREKFAFRTMLADSPVTRKKGKSLCSAGTGTGFYTHFNISFTRRNLYKINDQLNKRPLRTLPWYKEITKKKYDLVWFNVAALADLADLGYAVQLCKKTQTPYWLILQHGYEDFFFSSQEEMEVTAEVARSARRFIFIARQNRASLERALGEPLDNAFHSVNALTAAKIGQAEQLSRLSREREPGVARFFNMGRFSPRDKAQHVLLECFAGKAWSDRDWQLSFIGVSGFGKTYLEKLIRYYGLDPARIRIIAHTDDVFGILSEQDMLLMPSLSEGTPFAMVESMACGKPAIGTPVGGIPELIRDAQTGWLAKTTGAADFADKLEQAWQQRGDWERMGLAAQQFIRFAYNQELTFPPLMDLLWQDALT